MLKIYNKFRLTRDESLSLARRNVIDSIYKSAKLEGLLVTFPQTEAIYNGINVANLSVSDVVTINNLKGAWRFLFDTMEYPKVDFPFVCEINRIIGSNLFNNAGFLRKVPVSISGSKYRPPLPIKQDIISQINSIISNQNATDKALELMLYIMKKQMFLDGNKRTATICANRVLIENGAGLLSIDVENTEEFRTKLIKYYETDEKDEIKEFLFQKCINGIDPAAPSKEEIDEQQKNTQMFQKYLKKT